MMRQKESEVSNWWSSNPQSYGDMHGLAQHSGQETDFGDLEFFRRADETMFDWCRSLEKHQPFDRIFPYDRFKAHRVLEIGCGMGAMASLWAKQGADVTAVDLAPFSVDMTRRRFALMGLSGNISQSDGRDLPFADGMFDYTYSWGVLHHSPDLARSLQEMMRVLKRGGEFGLMLYHRRSLFYLWRILYREGFVHYERAFLDPVALASRYTDASEAEGNPHTWPVTRQELRGMLGPYATDIEFSILGEEVDHMVNMMLPGIGRFIPRALLRPWARRLGWSLWCSGRRR